MSWIRTAVFVSLTLVATTLPARSAAAPLRATAAGERPETPHPRSTEPVPGHGQPAPVKHAPTSSAPAETGLVLQAAPQIDALKGAPTRPMGHSGPQALPNSDPDVPAVWRPSATSGQNLQAHAVRVHEHAHEWLTCRYPNAPPPLA